MYGEMSKQQAFDMLKKNNPKASKEELNKASGNIANAIMSGSSAMASNLKNVIGSSAIKVDGNMKVSDMAQQINASAGSLAGTLVGGKTASDLATVAKSEKYKDGGYIGLQRDMGTTSGLMDIPESQRKKTLENIMDKAIFKEEERLLRKIFKELVL